MAKNLVIVESPAKAKTIQKFLGSTYKVIASNGHIRDLPKSELGIDVAHGFEPKYITIRGKGELVSNLKKETKKVERIYLATDPDREGEAISWHLMSALGLDKSNTRRVTFNEITKDTVKNAFKKARDIDENLVDAQQARRVLDRIVGYEISPVLWKKVRRGLSAGRVQSAALKLLCDRENEIADFVQEEYWSVEAEFIKEKARGFLLAKLTRVGRDKAEIATGGEADDLISRIQNCASFTVKEIKTGKRSRRAPLPFTTSTLQQEASHRLGFTPARTMQVAQQLYEGISIHGTSQGLITYLRTDSTRISEEADRAARDLIIARFGKEYDGPHTQAASARRIQDAHEAIRPTTLNLTPESIVSELTKEQYRLYKLIYERFLASRMAAAVYDTMQITLTGGEFEFVASGSTLAFPGFLSVYKDAAEDEEEKFHTITGLAEGDTVTIRNIEGHQHFTQPPARYTEASLIKTLEENGVGRPSTYAPILTTLLTRAYITKEKKVIYVTELGMTVNQMISNYFKEIVDIGFTAEMEKRLDTVEEGQVQWRKVIGDFYSGFEPQVQKAQTELEKVEVPVELTDKICDKCGKRMILRNGRFGKFYGCSGFPACRNTVPYHEYVEGVQCPLCGSQIEICISQKKRTYYRCADSQKCSFISWDRPVAKKCPRCGSYMVEKKGRTTRFCCSSKECGYSEKAES